MKLSLRSTSTYGLFVCVALATGDARAAHHCKSGESISVASSCAWGWNQEGTGAVDPWSTGGPASGRREVLGMSDCAELTVTEVKPAEHGYIGVSCVLNDGTKTDYWVNPQFLSCGDGVALRSVAPDQVSGPCQVDNNIPATPLVSTLGEQGAPTPVVSDAVAARQVADKTLSVLSTSQALAVLGQDERSPVRAEIARSLQAEYQLIQEARSNDLRLISSDYIDVTEAGAQERLNRSYERIKKELEALEAEVGKTCDEDLFLSGVLSPVRNAKLIQSNELKKACAQHQDALALLEEWRNRPEDGNASLQFVTKLLPAASGMKPSNDSRARRLILMSGVEKSDENLKNKAFRYAVALEAQELTAIPYIHDGYLLGGSRKEGGRGTDCSEFVFGALQRTCTERGADQVAPSTKMYRLFAEMLRGSIPWDEEKVGALARYRTCFDAPEISHDEPPQGMDILVSHQPGNRVGHIAWVLSFDAKSGNVQTVEAAGGAIGSAVSTQRPVYEQSCRRTQNVARVPRADLVLLRLKPTLDASCPLVR